MSINSIAFTVQWCTWTDWEGGRCMGVGMSTSPHVFVYIPVTPPPKKPFLNTGNFLQRKWNSLSETHIRINRFCCSENLKLSVCKMDTRILVWDIYSGVYHEMFNSLCFRQQQISHSTLCHLIKSYLRPLLLLKNNFQCTYRTEPPTNEIVCRWCSQFKKTGSIL